MGIFMIFGILCWGTEKLYVYFLYVIFYYTSCMHFHSNQITLQVLKGQYYNIQILNSHISTFEHFEVNHQQEKSFHLYSNQSLFEVWNKFRICLSNEPFNHYSDLIHGFSSWCFCVCLFYVPDYFSREGHLSFKLRIQSNWTEFTDWMTFLPSNLTKSAHIQTLIAKIPEAFNQHVIAEVKNENEQCWHKWEVDLVIEVVILCTHSVIVL